MARRTYTADEKAAALAAYLADGAAEASRATGIPRGTIVAWASHNGDATVRNEQQLDAVACSQLAWEKRRVDLAVEIGAVAELALQRCHQSLTGDGLLIKAIDAKGQPYDRIPGPADAKNLATTMAILVDKAQLLTGAATSRNEHATSPARAAAALDEIAARRARSNAA
jgi:hypothetical protein